MAGPEADLSGLEASHRVIGEAIEELNERLARTTDEYERAEIPKALLHARAHLAESQEGLARAKDAIADEAGGLARTWHYYKAAITGGAVILVAALAGTAAALYFCRQHHSKAAACSV